MINMKIELITIIKWLSCNKLSFNASKTEFMKFDGIDDTLELLELSGTYIKISECKVTKYLGLMLDSKLTFKQHVDYTGEKL